MIDVRLHHHGAHRSVYVTMDKARHWASLPVPVDESSECGTIVLRSADEEDDNMAVDHAADVKRYVPGADDTVVQGIIKHLGIALRSADASFVSCSSKDELERVRESWLKKKLALTDDDKALDGSIATICEKMKADKNKSRVTFYYLLAEKHGKLGMFAG